MPISVPDNPKVYTTKYDNFKGVDYTNDASNVWHRRSPTGVNMLPDAAGRPFKRHGWEILISNDDICTALGVDSCTITKTTWFELAGMDHIVIFTDQGVVFYNGSVTATETDPGCYTSYDRCFFFEGNGTSAFYIYGAYKMWMYGYENGAFTLTEITDKITVPTVIFSASADGVGEVYEGYNLLGNLASVEYNDYELFTYYGSDGLIFTVDDAAFKTTYTKHTPLMYWWKYNGSSWVWQSSFSPAPSFDTNIIKPVNAKSGDEIVVLYGHGLMLPNNIDVTTQVDDVKVFVSNATQFDTEIPVVSVSSSFVSGKALVVQDAISRENRRAHIEFYSSDTYKTGADFQQQDTFKTIFPVTEVTIASQSISPITGTAHLVYEG